jgi:hypothetical protein
MVSAMSDDAEEVKALRRDLIIAKAMVPHFYFPSTMHMGDCALCGNLRDAPQHNFKELLERIIIAVQEMPSQYGQLVMRDEAVAEIRKVIDGKAVRTPQ